MSQYHFDIVSFVFIRKGRKKAPCVLWINSNKSAGHHFSVLTLPSPFPITYGSKKSNCVISRLVVVSCVILSLRRVDVVRARWINKRAVTVIFEENL